MGPPTGSRDGSRAAIDKILDAGVHVFSHNMESVKRLFSKIRPMYEYSRSLKVLRYAYSREKAIVKSGFMVGLGETPGEIFDFVERPGEVVERLKRYFGE